MMCILRYRSRGFISSVQSTDSIVLSNKERLDKERLDKERLDKEQLNVKELFTDCQPFHIIP